MHCNQCCATRRLGVLVLFILALLLLPGVAFAKHEPKAYPESGKVIGTGLNSHNKSHPVTGGQNGTPVTGGGTYTVYSHTYKIETDTKI